MKDIQQLIKKNSQEGRYENIFPKTFTDAIIDRENGAKLTDILAMFNMLFLSYVGSKSLTRLEVPISLRKTGIWITYVLYDKTVVTEWYAGEAIDDTSFSNDSNWRDGTNSLVGDISISSDGYWVINGEVTTIEARGEAGITPILRVGSNNHLQVSYTNGSSYIDVSPNPVYTQFRVLNNKLQQSTDLGNTYTYISEELAYKFQESGNKLQMSKDLGNTWEDVSDYIAAWFRFTGTTGSSQADNVGKIQISRDNGVTWSDLSSEFTNSLHIKGYVATIATLPSSAVQGDIYGVGPTYDPSDTGQTNPIYQLYVKDSTGWVNNGKFTSITAGVVQTTGDDENAVMSQKVTTEKLTELESKMNPKFSQLDQISISTINNVGFDAENTALVSSVNDIVIDNLQLVKGIQYKVALSIPVALGDNLLLKLCDSKGNQIKVVEGIGSGTISANITITLSDTYFGASLRLRNNISTSITAKVTYVGQVFPAIDKCFKWGEVIALSENLTDFDITTIRDYRCVTLEAPEGYTFSQLPEIENTGISVYGLRRWNLLVFPNWYYNNNAKVNIGIIYILTRVAVANNGYKRYYIGYCHFSDHTIHWERFLTENSTLNYTKKAIVQGDSIANYMMGLIDNSTRRYSDYELVKVAIAGSSIAHGGGTTPNLWKSLVDRSKTDNADYIDVSGAKKLIIWMGVNDKEHSVQFGEDGTTDETTIEGAMRVAVNNFLTVNPTLSICFVTPNNSPYHNAANSIGKTLEDYAEEIVAVSKKLNVDCFDLYHCSCINDANKVEIFNRPGDDIHPNNDWLINVAADYIMKLI